MKEAHHPIPKHKPTPNISIGCFFQMKTCKTLFYSHLFSVLLLFFAVLIHGFPDSIIDRHKILHRKLWKIMKGDVTPWKV